jgi:hypothetical protein
MSYKLFSDELIEACWNHPERWVGFTKEEFPESAVCNMNAMHEHLIEKGFSQLEIDDMKFEPLRPNGPNNDWVIPEGCVEVEIDGGIEGYLVYVKRRSKANFLIASINANQEHRLWKAYDKYPKDIFVFEPNSAEWLTKSDYEDDKDSESEEEESEEEESDSVDIDVLKAQMKELQNSVAKMAKLLAKLGV